MPKLIDLTGQRFGRLTVVDRCGCTSDGHSAWLCKCDCGKTSVVNGRYLTHGNTTSCGCFHKEMLSKRSTTHRKVHTRLYSIWTNMISRCTNEKVPCYHCYGGRGITVCDEWKNDFMTFYEWAMANGYADNLTIDRADNDGNYEPSNCRWITMKEQSQNRRKREVKNVSK